MCRSQIPRESQAHSGSRFDGILESVNVALTIAGSDPSGGAGVQADLKTFHQFGVYGEAAVTLLTVQNTLSVERVECMDPGLVADQVRCVLADIPPHAIKTGALGNAAIIEAVAMALSGGIAPIVIDPVMVSKHGAPLMDSAANQTLIEQLLPLAMLLTPNIEEAQILTGLTVKSTGDMRQAAEKLADMGARSVLIKGGHLAGDAIDVLYYDGRWFEYPAARVDTPHTHGTGCTYSAAITAGLALGHELPAAVEQAKRFITEAIRFAPGFGAGCGPVNHFVNI